MNILLIIAIIFALSGFKPNSSNGDKGQVTQGYYNPSSYFWRTRRGKKQMNTPAALGLHGDISILGNNGLIEKGVKVDQYFNLLNKDGKTWTFYMHGSGNSVSGYGSVEPFRADNYTTENLT